MLNDSGAPQTVCHAIKVLGAPPTHIPAMLPTGISKVERSFAAESQS
ncbi:uncharacterized protein METZ01_LOCUS59279 [marine metagenome]|uniref:Uncharacterized protein n=1 Tax=marine metagenome TaxID=408172 RepID=A0A381SQW8_9ZZZZ